MHFVNRINQHLTSFLHGSNNVIIGLTHIMVLMKDKGVKISIALILQDKILSLTMILQITKINK
jgi:hypothetical protein